MRGGLERIGRGATILSALSVIFVSPADAQRRAAARPPIADYAFLIGIWTDSNDCNANIELASDGMFHTSGNRHGYWVVDGNRMTMTGSSTMTVQVSATDRNHIRVVNPDGSVGISTRCPATGPAPRPPAPRLSPAFFVGRWTDDSNCNNATSFDGTGGFMASNGGQGRWSLAGNQLSLAAGTAGATVLRLFPIGPNTIMVINRDGSGGRSTRC